MSNHPNRSKIKFASNMIRLVHADYLARDKEHVEACPICSTSTSGNPARCPRGQITYAQLEVAALISGKSIFN